MVSLQNALGPMQGSEIMVFLNHPDLRTLNGRLIAVQSEHIVIRAGQDYHIPYLSLVAVRRI
jgi:hypothetical protein